MPLGDQFINTYWEDSSKPGTFKTSRELDLQEQYRARDTRAGARFSKGGSIDTVPEGYQGMLFSPFEGTGLLLDPSDNKQERRKAVNKVLSINEPTRSYQRRKPLLKSNESHLQDIREDAKNVRAGLPSKFADPNASYIKRKKQALAPRASDSLKTKLAKRVVGSSLFVNPYTASREQKVLSDSLFYSGMPTQEIKRLGQPGFSAAENADSVDTIAFNKLQTRVLKDKDSVATASLPPNLSAKKTRIQLFNLAGVGKLKKKLDTPEYEQAVDVIRKSPMPTIITHELGHSQDKGIDSYTPFGWKQYKDASGKNYEADPLTEGIADGYAGRNNDYSLYTQRQLRDLDLPGEGAITSGMGYTDRAKTWDTDEKRALYEMARWATVTGSPRVQNVPSRSSLVASNDRLYRDYTGSIEDARAIDDHVMHVILENNPEVMTRLSKIESFSHNSENKPQSLGDVARKASQRHLEKLYGPKPVQQTLF